MDTSIYAGYPRDAWGAFHCPFCHGKGNDDRSLYVFPYLKTKSRELPDGTKEQYVTTAKVSRAYYRCFQCGTASSGPHSVPVVLQTLRETYRPMIYDIHRLRLQMRRKYFRRFPSIERSFSRSFLEGRIAVARTYCRFCEPDMMGRSAYLLASRVKKTNRSNLFALYYACARCKMNTLANNVFFTEWAARNIGSLEWQDVYREEFFQMMGVDPATLESYIQMFGQEAM